MRDYEDVEKKQPGVSAFHMPVCLCANATPQEICLLELEIVIWLSGRLCGLAGGVSNARGVVERGILFEKTNSVDLIEHCPWI